MTDNLGMLNITVTFFSYAFIFALGLRPTLLGNTRGQFFDWSKMAYFRLI